jgi:hypothetical protein
MASGRGDVLLHGGHVSSAAVPHVRHLPRGVAGSVPRGASLAALHGGGDRAPAGPSDTVWELPRGDTDYTTRGRQIKTHVTRALEGRLGGTAISASRRRRAEKGIWQRRFYEHLCRDEADVKRLVDYIHVNPVKHRLSARVRDWPWSSFHRYVRLGEYAIDWGSSDLWYGDEFTRLE